MFCLACQLCDTTLWKGLAPEDPCKFNKKKKSSDNAQDLYNKLNHAAYPLANT